MNYNTLQNIAVSVMMGAMIGAFIIIGMMVETNRMEAQRIKELRKQAEINEAKAVLGTDLTMEELAESCIRVRSKGGVITQRHINECNERLQHLMK